MKIKALSISLALLWGVSGAALGADAAPAVAPNSPEAMAATMWDFTRNPEYLKDPKKFVPWLNAALEPSFYTGLGMQMMDPGMWALMANSMMNPNAYSAWMPLMTDPNIYMKWLAASMDPNFYNAVLGQFSDTAKMMRWAMAPADPKTINLMLQSLNPNVYLKWLMSPLDPRWLQAMITPINPNAYMGWLGATLNPGSYGDLWKGFLNPTLPATTGAPAPAWNVPGGSLPYFNPLDPNAWSQMWQAPLQAPPVNPPAAK
jgi:hypothetical protein